MSRKVKINERE